MPITPEVIAALIGAVSVLIISVIGTIRNCQQAKRELVRERLEKAYVPLNYLIYTFITSEDGNIAEVRGEISKILKGSGHLLTKQTLSNLYILVDPSISVENTRSTIKQFIQEYEALRDAFYKDQSTSLAIVTVKV